MTFVPGVTTNPTGKNGFSTGMQPFAKRAEHLLNKYKLPEIKRLAADDDALADAMSSWDGIVCKRLAAMIDGRADERAEVALLLDRKEGKAVERKEIRVIRGWGDLTEEELIALTGDEVLQIVDESQEQD